MGNSCILDLGLGAQAGKELERCQQQADEVTEIMLDNYQKVMERDGKLSELEQRSHKLLDMVCGPGEWGQRDRSLTLRELLSCGGEARGGVWDCWFPTRGLYKDTLGLGL